MAQRFPILVATDGSGDATDAVEAVTVFPWPAGTRVHGVVVRNTADLVDVPAEVWTQIEEGFVAVAEGARKALGRRWPDPEVRVVGGPIVDAILARARQVGARVIVLGSRGHGPIARLLVGSTSLGVARRMTRANVFVPENVRALLQLPCRARQRHHAGADRIHSEFS